MNKKQYTDECEFGEANKMRTNKGQGQASSPSELELANNVKNYYSVWSKALLKRINSQPFTSYSEASISMLVDCFSP
ncbi:hypothetical protein CTI12_AA237410 [Artemisia annua]|uniref:Uncharacterized protein n=1 Tax=Artemisia annua TaxID=35608 RepID=A0A2U1NRU1_ARTAN|nr:hypothetical protein CTI12_AA237410 [Artemisia annua]